MRSAILLAVALAATAPAAELPGRCYKLIESGAAQVEARLNQEADPRLETLEKGIRWRHFFDSVLAPPVLLSPLK